MRNSHVILSNGTLAQTVGETLKSCQTPRERRIRKIAELTRAISAAQKDIPLYGQKAIDFINRKKAERDALMLTTDDGEVFNPTDPEVIRYLGTPESRAAVEELILAVSPEFTAPLPESMPETQEPGGEYF